MTFESELDPDGSKFMVTDGSGVEVGAGELDLDVADRNEMRGDVEISEPGIYTVTWTTVAADGDEDSGEFTFGYRADPAGSTDEGGPNTATSSGGDLRLVVAGAALLTIAASRSVRSQRPWRGPAA